MIDPEVLTRPLSPEAPCGPDLDTEGDLDYMNLMARVEGDLPASFFAFDRASIDFKADCAALEALLARSLDLRPVVMLAKLATLDRNLGSFTDWLSVCANLLSAYWGPVHPSADEGQAALRSAVLQSLDDLPTVILPLQYAPLVSSRRTGTITFRHHLVAIGEVARREGESEIDGAGIEQALAGAEIGELVDLRDLLARLAGAVESIRKTWMTQAGFDDAPTLERLPKLVGRMLTFIGDEVSRRAPDAPKPADAETEEGPAEDAADAPQAETALSLGGSAIRIGSAAAAAKAFAGVIGYLVVFEPSNPALLLVHQAQQLVGRSFVEIMQLLMPDAMSQARITVGVEQPFVFKLDQLTDVVAPPETRDADGGDMPAVTLRSRRDVQQVLDQIAAFYRRAEPSNPIPLLCDRARNMCALDFAALLKDMVPKPK